MGRFIIKLVRLILKYGRFSLVCVVIQLNGNSKYIEYMNNDFKIVVHILNILAVAIQLNDHANKAESPILQNQAHELDDKSTHNSKLMMVSKLSSLSLIP